MNALEFWAESDLTYWQYNCNRAIENRWFPVGIMPDLQAWRSFADELPPIDPELQQLAYDLMRRRRVTKSQMIKRVAKKLGLPIVNLRMSKRTKPADFAGLPFKK